jgi:hypothetical protein
MTKLNWDKAKKWREPSWMEDNRRVLQYMPPTQPHPDLLKWDMEKYEATQKRDRDEVIRKAQEAKRRKQQTAHRKFLDTSVYCRNCNKKRTGRDMHTQLCKDIKETEKYGWHYGKKPPSLDAIKHGHVKKNVKYEWERNLETMEDKNV